MTDLRLMPCEYCGSEGRIIVALCPSRMNEWPEEDRGPCPVCEGTGMALIEVEPIDEYDLERLAA